MMAYEKNVLQHFAKEEKVFVEKILDICQQVEETYSYRLTAFLNPRQDEIAHQIANHYQLQIFSSRDIVPTEHSRVIIAPAYYELEFQDFQIAAINLSYPRKFYTLSHSQVLGTLLHQLGIKREYLGDILLGDEELIVMLDQKLSQMALQSITKIARVPVKCVEYDWTLVQVPNETPHSTKEVLVSSMRLDKLISVAFNLSRNTVSKLVETGQVKVDYVQTVQSSRVIEVGQLISVRKYGRIQVNDCLGFSKQGKVKLQLDIVKT